MSTLLRDLCGRYGLVAVISGRPAAQVRELLGAEGPQGPMLFGLYGLEGQAATPEVRDALAPAEALAATVPGSWVEDKGPSLAVHYRASSDPAAALERLTGPLEELGRRHGLRVMPGKMVLELASREIPGKGVVVRREVLGRGLSACLYAGDDLADLAAFAALDTLREEGLVVVKVTVRSEETPPELLDAADLVVDRPRGLVELLRRL